MPAASLVTFLATAALSAFGLPLGLPPGPEDPILHRIAPAQPLVYLTWSPSISPQPSSASRLDQLLADPEIARSGAAIDKVLTKALDEALGRMPAAEAAAAKKVYGISKLLVRQPGAAFVEVMPSAMNADPDVRIGMLLKAGEHSATVQQALDEFVATAPPGVVATVDIAGRKFRRIAGNNPKDVVTWGMLGQYLAVGIGQDVVQGIFARASQAPPRWLTDVQARAPMARRASIFVVNLKAAKSLLPPIPEADAKPMKALGIDNFVMLESVTGIDGESVVSRSLFRTEGTPTGLLAPTTGPGITAADFANMPAGAQHCIVLKGSAASTIKLLLDTASATGGPAPNFQMADAMLGMSVQRDLIPAIGEKAFIWIGRAATPITPPPVMISIELKDRAKVAAAIERVAALASQPGAGPPGLQINKQNLGDAEVSTLQIPIPGVPAISWAVLADRLVIATKSQMIGDQAKKPATFKSLADTPELVRALGESKSASTVIYEDPREVYRLLYAGAGIGLTFAGGSIPPNLAEDITLDLLPEPEAISKHLRPDVTTLSLTPAGIEVQSRTSAVMLNSTHWLLPLAAGAAIGGGRGEVKPFNRRMVSTNNLKQIGLALHNYHSTMGKFPPAYTVDKNGKPLHSWRTLILPFVEQAGLYDKIKLDEPWNSEHNMKLFKGHVIDVYNSPGAGPPSTKTTYQTIRAPGSLFPGDKAQRIDDIRDGASNTVMVVETNPAKGVEWFMPDDYTPTAPDPVQGLKGVWPGLILAGFADGSVRSVSDRMTPDLFQRLTNISDGKTIDFNEVEGGRTGPPPGRIGPAPGGLGPPPGRGGFNPAPPGGPDVRPIPKSSAVPAR